MKSKNYLRLCIAFLFFLNACKKPDSRSVQFTSTTYKFLSAFDSSGTPVNMLKDTVSNDLLYFIYTTLPPGENQTLMHPEFFSKTANDDILITQKSDVYITFVSEGSGETNSLAFYTYPTNQPPENSKDIDTITYVFPNAGQKTGLIAGDKMKIGTFNPGTSIGFVIMSGAWNMTTKKLNNNAIHYCSDDNLNPEVNPNLRKHAVFINYPPEKLTLISFEDMDRSNPYCDNDFNDVIFYATIKN